eukprot:CAMPEP_0119025628 /NCGR_PEP_ID=MMETSP1176-20130426/34047_1 /TAXON_ID=265551 /ORGANISM="Synedropsis recta cf, Strain CCMP1620" /LENGTH=263 /DNA_ID=CAMNT_0006981195 /DNA_START=1060 /DNA_END=1849 /DNA_ORIENTATION=-
MIDDVPSKTALIVAVLLVIVHTANDKVTPPGAAKAQLDLLKKVTLVNAGPLWFLTKNVSFCRFLCIICHTVVVPKFAEGLGFRELFMDQSVRKFLRSNKAAKEDGSPGAAPQQEQVLVVAAGYDTLCYRLAKEYPHVSFWEIDHPAAGGVKKEAIAKMGQPSNVHLIAADLTQTDYKQVLVSQEPNGYDMSKPTIVILEGLLFYLEEPVVKQLFSNLTQVVGPSSQVAFDYFSLDLIGNMSNGWMTGFQSFLVKKMGERWHWG